MRFFVLNLIQPLPFMINRRTFLSAVPLMFLLDSEISYARTKNQLSFSTLGCPDWDMETIIANAVKFGYPAIEFRGLGKEIDLLKCKEFSGTGIAETTRRFRDAGLKIVNLGSSANLHFHEESRRASELDHGRKYIELAEKLGCPFVRVFPNNLPKEYSKEATLEKIAAGLNELCRFSGNSGVTVLLETHGDVVYSKDILWIMKNTVDKNKGLIWDFFNMYVVTRESPQLMYDTLKDYISHTHLKDGLINADGKFSYLAAGAGNGPIGEAVKILKNNKYKGYYSFEWEKRWHPEIEKPEVVFPDYVKFMNRLV
jgi:sugar phosphate isomerase/epimerase